MQHRLLPMKIGDVIKLINFPGSPHWEKCEFLIFLINLATSNGDVLIQFNDGIPSLRCKFGTWSLGLFTEDFDANKSLYILLCCFGSWTVISFSTKGGIFVNLLFFISFNKIEKKNFADIEGFFKVLFTVLLKASFERQFALLDSLAASLAFIQHLFFLFFAPKLYFI